MISNRKIKVQRRNMPHFKAFGFINLQYEKIIGFLIDLNTSKSPLKLPDL